MRDLSFSFWELDLKCGHSHLAGFCHLRSRCYGFFPRIAGIGNRSLVPFFHGNDNRSVSVSPHKCWPGLLGECPRVSSEGKKGSDFDKFFLLEEPFFGSGRTGTLHLFS